jgi:hypothetical protein
MGQEAREEQAKSLTRLCLAAVGPERADDEGNHEHAGYQRYV